MNENIKKYIPVAYKIIQDYENSLEKKPIDKELKGYIPSLGASILMSGLIPSLAIYAAEDNNSQASRFIILDWISRIIGDKINFEPVQNNENEKEKEKANENAVEFFRFILKKNETEQKRIEAEILEATVALKLCIRTFKLSDDEQRD